MSLPTHSYLVFSLLTFSLYAKPAVLFLSQDGLKNSPDDSSSAPTHPDSAEWDDEFGYSDSHKSDEELDTGSWRPIIEPDSSAANADPGSEANAVYYSGLSKMVKAVSSGEVSLMVEAVEEIETAVAVGHPHAMSVLGFLHGSGHMRERNKAKAFMYHYFAAEGGNMQSKMALAYTYFKQEMYEKSIKLYSELAEAAVNSFLIPAKSPVVKPVSIHNEGEENKEALRKFRGEEDEDFQILEYQAKQKGNPAAMYKMGLFYYFGLRGLRRDHAKALSWFLKAVDKSEPRSMELLGQIYASGNDGVERNYTKAFEWLTLASEQELYSAYNGLGYLYLKGYGVEKNHSKAMKYFEKAANNEEAGAYYNLGVMFLKGISVERDVKLATKYFISAANAGQEKAFYQLAKMFHSGVGLKKNLLTAASLYKLVTEKGAWSSLSTWAVKAYLKGDIGKAFLLYSRMAELGYEVAQSNAAWILDKYGEQSMCIGESGFCTVEERHQLAHSLWWHAYKQGHEYAAFLMGHADASYYGRGTQRDHDPAADAYTNATKVADACGCIIIKSC